MKGETAEVVHSLAKWKRMALYEYGFLPGEGLYTNMNAIRRDEELDNLHSCYVDQWDWEKVITKEERTEETLKETVRSIFKIIKHMQHEVWYKYPDAAKKLPGEVTFITSQELEDRYPDKTPKERENPRVLDASRKKRIAAGCGLEVADVNRLLKQYEMMLQLTKSLSKGKMPLGLGKMPNIGKIGGMGKMHGFGRKKRLK